MPRPAKKLAPPVGPPLSAVGNLSEPTNLSSYATAATIQAAIRAAEAGDTRNLFALYRDSVLGDEHIQSELSKRKLATLNEARNVLPYSDDPADVAAAQACERAIEDCENWTDALIWLLNGTVWPVAVAEKIFRPGDTGSGLQYTLDCIHPVNYALLCYGFTPTVAPPAAGAEAGRETWEAALRIYPTDARGGIVLGSNAAYALDPLRHVVHRGHTLAGVRDNWGGPMRSILGWWLLRQLGREWFGRFMERYGAPFIVAKTDVTNPAAVTFVKSALSLATKLCGLVLSHEDSAELKEAVVSGGADGHERFHAVCNAAISRLIVGGDLSSSAKATGLGSGVADLQGGVRDDLRAFDQLKLAETIRQQIFRPLLDVNGLTGRAPRIVWGGLDPAESAALADLLVKLTQAGLEPSDDAIPGLSERVGFSVQRKAAAPPATLQPVTLSALPPKRASLHPSDAVADRQAAALAQAFRGSLAPVRQAVLDSVSPEDLRRRLAVLYADWKPGKVAEIADQALQLCALAALK